MTVTGDHDRRGPPGPETRKRRPAVTVPQCGPVAAAAAAAFKDN